MSIAFRLAKGRLELYRGSVQDDAWRGDHRLAALCFDFQEMCREGVSLLEAIFKSEEDWRSLVHRKRLDYDAQVEAHYQSLFHDWREISLEVLRIYEEHLESEYLAREFDQSVVEQLRSGVREVEGCLTPDEQFFAGEATADLADDAVREHRGGNTIEW